MKYKIELEIDVPCESWSDVRDWASYRTGYTGGLSLDNPLSNIELEAQRIHIERL